MLGQLLHLHATNGRKLVDEANPISCYSIVHFVINRQMRVSSGPRSGRVTRAEFVNRDYSNSSRTRRNAYLRLMPALMYLSIYCSSIHERSS